MKGLKTGMLFAGVIILGFLFDLLFWDHEWGINFPIYVIFLLAGGIYLAYRESIKIEKIHGFLMAGILFFALSGLWRREPLGLFMNLVLTLGMMATLAVSFRKALWPSYGLLDYIEKIGMMPFRGLRSFGEIRPEEKRNGKDEGKRKGLGGIARGFLLALPIVFILGSLLASADYFFAEWVNEIFSFLDLDNLAELFGRGILILVVSYILLGVYVFALKNSQDEKLLGDGKSLLPPFLGFQEAVIVLGSVIGLFAIFVGIQLRYFFGGTVNINLDGFTYAEYARQGFGELVAVAVISVALFVALSLVSKRKTEGEKKWFSGMGTLLFALVGVILISAYQRLLLYESVYGFTRTRTNVHVFMIWLGVFLIALIALEISGRRRFFTLALMLGLLGFAASVNILNVDAFIVRANAERLRLTGVIDVAYLALLSTDATPVLIEEAENSSEGDSQKLIAALACQAMRNEGFEESGDWQAFTFSLRAARNGWEEFLESPDAKRIEAQANDEFYVERMRVDGESFDCWNFGTLD